MLRRVREEVWSCDQTREILTDFSLLTNYNIKHLSSFLQHEPPNPRLVLERRRAEGGEDERSTGDGCGLRATSGTNHQMLVVTNIKGFAAGITFSGRLVAIIGVTDP